MPYKIEKEDLPEGLNLRVVKYNGQNAMMNISTDGPIIMFPDTDEIKLVSWDEIVEFAFSRPCFTPEEIAAINKARKEMMKKNTKIIGGPDEPGQQ